MVLALRVVIVASDLPLCPNGYVCLVHLRRSAQLVFRSDPVELPRIQTRWRVESGERRAGFAARFRTNECAHGLNAGVVGKDGGTSNE